MNWWHRHIVAQSQLSPQLEPFRQEIVQYGSTMSIKSLLDSYDPVSVEDLKFLLNASGQKWSEVSFPKKVESVFVVSNASGETEIVIEPPDWVYDAHEWVRDQEPFHYLELQEENFWNNVPKSGYVLYHGTTEENIDSIKINGLEVRDETRGISNRNTSSGVFTSGDLSTAQYYDVVVEIDISAMKQDGYTPRVGQEEPIEEGRYKAVLANYIGLHDYIDDESIYSSDGLRDDNVIFYDLIPHKYLTISETS